MANYRNTLVTDSEFINISRNEAFELSWLLMLHKYSKKRHLQKKVVGHLKSVFPFLRCFRPQLIRQSNAPLWNWMRLSDMLHWQDEIHLKIESRPLKRGSKCFFCSCRHMFCFIYLFSPKVEVHVLHELLKHKNDPQKVWAKVSILIQVYCET